MESILLSYTQRKTTIIIGILFCNSTDKKVYAKMDKQNVADNKQSDSTMGVILSG